MAGLASCGRIITLRLCSGCAASSSIAGNMRPSSASEIFLVAALAGEGQSNRSRSDAGANVQHRPRLGSWLQIRPGRERAHYSQWPLGRQVGNFTGQEYRKVAFSRLQQTSPLGTQVPLQHFPFSPQKYVPQQGFSGVRQRLAPVLVKQHLLGRQLGDAQAGGHTRLTFGPPGNPLCDPLLWLRPWLVAVS
jgi:hypothetical protein